MEGEGVVLGLVVICRRIIVLFCRVVLAVSSSRVPVDASSLFHCFCMGRSSFCGKRSQVVVVFMHGGGRFCGGVHSRYFGVLLIIWAVVLVCGWSSLLYGQLWQPGGGGLSLALGVSPLAVVAAVVMCHRSVVCWCVSLDWLGWDWDAHQSTTNDDFVVCRLFATSLSVTWHLEGALARETDGDNLLWRVTTLHVVTVRQHRVVVVNGRASWMVVVVEDEPCGLLIAPKSSIGICRRSLWA